MSTPQHVSVTLSTMFTPCPYCHAAPLTPCKGEGRELRYTHAERNRT